MTKFHPQNERIKREYFIYLKEADGYSEPSIDGAAKALHRFESYTGFKDFKLFHHGQAAVFKAHLAKQIGRASGKTLSKATIHGTLGALRKFFRWLAGQRGYKSRFAYSDAEYFNMSDKDARIARAPRYRPVPTVDQILLVIRTMPDRNDIERRDRALVALTLLTGVRDGAVIGLKLRHLDVNARRLHQDPNDVNTKFSKSLVTDYFPVPGNLDDIIENWVGFLTRRGLGGKMTLCFPHHIVNLGRKAFFWSKAWNGSTGSRLRRCGMCSKQHLRMLGYRTSILTVSGKRLPRWGKSYVRARRSLKRGAKTWATIR